MMLRLHSRLLFVLALLFASPMVAQQIITTVAGGGPNGIPAVSANTNSPLRVTIDSAGNYFVSTVSRVFKVDTQGTLTVVAGTGVSGPSGDGGPATNADVSARGLAIDSAGNLFIADADHHKIRRVDVVTGIITSVVGSGAPGFDGDGGPATSASLNYPTDVKFDEMGNLFIADLRNQRIRRVDATTGIITTVAGNGTAGFSGDGGPATSASLWNPGTVTVDSAGNLFIADVANLRIRKVNNQTGTIATVAGNGTRGFGGDGGPATAASMNDPNGVTVDRSDNLFIADSLNNRIRRVDANGIINTVAGNGDQGFSGDGGFALNARLFTPSSTALDGAGNLFIADNGNNRVRSVDATTGIISTMVGNGTRGFSGDNYLATQASLYTTAGIAFDGAGNLFIAEYNNERVRRIDAMTGIINTVAGNGSVGFSGDGGLATNASLNFGAFLGAGIALDTSGNLFIADSGNYRVRRVDAMTGIITTVAGNGTRGFSGDGGQATSAALNFPFSVAVDGNGNLFLADNGSFGNRRVRRVDAMTGIITTIAGNGNPNFSGDGGPATSAGMDPLGLAFDTAGNLLIVDSGNQRIRRVNTTTGIITTIAGNGGYGFSGDGGPATSATLYYPNRVGVDWLGNLFIADTSNQRIRRVDALTGIITTVAGNGMPSFSGDAGPPTSASLSYPVDVAIDGMGNLFISDSANNRIRLVQ